MKELTQEQIVRLYNVVDLGTNETIEKGYHKDNTIELTIRDTLSNGIKSYKVDFTKEPTMLDFVINGIQLWRDEK